MDILLALSQKAVSAPFIESVIDPVAETKMRKRAPVFPEGSPFWQNGRYGWLIPKTLPSQVARSPFKEQGGP
jgi:hypothetical protein